MIIYNWSGLQPQPAWYGPEKINHLLGKLKKEKSIKFVFFFFAHPKPLEEPRLTSLILALLAIVTRRAVARPVFQACRAIVAGGAGGHYNEKIKP